MDVRDLFEPEDVIAAADARADAQAEAIDRAVEEEEERGWKAGRLQAS